LFFFELSPQNNISFLSSFLIKKSFTNELDIILRRDEFNISERVIIYSDDVINKSKWMVSFKFIFIIIKIAQKSVIVSDRMFGLDCF